MDLLVWKGDSFYGQSKLKYQEEKRRRLSLSENSFEEKLEEMLDAGQIVTATVTDAGMEKYMQMVIDYHYLSIPLIVDGTTYQFAMYPLTDFKGLYN